MNTLFIDPGRFRAELSLDRLDPVADGMGGYTESWVENSLVWGRIEPVSATSRLFGTRPQPEVSHRITLRFNADIQSGMRLRKGSRVFTIGTVHDPDESGRYLVCLVSEEGR